MFSWMLSQIPRSIYHQRADGAQDLLWKHRAPQKAGRNVHKRRKPALLWRVCGLLKEKPEVVVGNNNMQFQAREKEGKSFFLLPSKCLRWPTLNIWSPSVFSHIMPVPDWNKQLYLDPCFLPSDADKRTYSYQREIQAEGRKIYACLKPASTLPNCSALWRNVKFNHADFYFPGGCRSQHRRCSRHPPASQHTAPICFYV